jgi:hypothetical protein
MPHSATTRAAREAGGAVVVKRSPQMKRDVALRLDALLMGVRGSLDMIAHYMKTNLSDEEYRENRPHIARAMTELIEISNKLHQLFPDSVPDELR